MVTARMTRAYRAIAACASVEFLCITCPRSPQPCPSSDLPTSRRSSSAYEGPRLDQYGRTQAYLYREIVAKGYAGTSPQFPDSPVP